MLDSPSRSLTTGAKAETLWVNGDYAKAEKIYDVLAEDYREVSSIEDNYGSLARLRQLECLRKLGDYKRLAKKSPALRKAGLAASYHAQLELYSGWASLAKMTTKEDAKQLERLVDDYQERDVNPEQLAQAFYLSGVANEKLGNVSNALSDYHRAFTLNFGSDRDLAKMAMAAALKLYASDDRIDKNRQRLVEAHGLATIYEKVHGKVSSGSCTLRQALASGRGRRVKIEAPRGSPLVRRRLWQIHCGQLGFA